MTPSRTYTGADIMKIDKIPDYIDPSLNLEQIRDECHDLIKKSLRLSRSGDRADSFLTWQ